MTESRVEAVARAICQADGVDPEKPCGGLGNRIPIGETWPAWRVRVTQAQSAIEASDAWLKAQGWEMTPAGSLLASRRASDPPQRKGLGVVVIDSSEEITSDMSDALNRAIDKGPDK